MFIVLKERVIKRNVNRRTRCFHALSSYVFTKTLYGADPPTYSTKNKSFLSPKAIIFMIYFIRLIFLLIRLFYVARLVYSRRNNFDAVTEKKRDFNSKSKSKHERVRVKSRKRCLRTSRMLARVS